MGAYKLAAYVLSGILVGMAGALDAYFLGFISPTSAFDRSANITLPLMAFLGGVGTVSGPLLGALIAVPLQQYLTMQVGTQGWDLILAGGMFLVVIRLLPEGLMPTRVRRRSRWMAPRSQTSPSHLLTALAPDRASVLEQPSSVPVPPETQSAGRFLCDAATVLESLAHAPTPAGAGHDGRASPQSQGT